MRGRRSRRGRRPRRRYQRRTEPEKPKFEHPLNTSKGRIERAVWTLLEGERQGLQVALTMSYLEKKGCSDAEIMAALDQAAGSSLFA